MFGIGSKKRRSPEVVALDAADRCLQMRERLRSTCEIVGGTSIAQDFQVTVKRHGCKASFRASNEETALTEALRWAEAK